MLTFVVREDFCLSKKTSVSNLQAFNFLNILILIRRLTSRSDNLMSINRLNLGCIASRSKQPVSQSDQGIILDVSKMWRKKLSQISIICRYESTWFKISNLPFVRIKSRRVPYGTRFEIEFIRISADAHQLGSGFMSRTLSIADLFLKLNFKCFHHWVEVGTRKSPLTHEFLCWQSKRCCEVSLIIRTSFDYNWSQSNNCFNSLRAWAIGPRNMTGPDSWNTVEGFVS